MHNHLHPKEVGLIRLLPVVIWSHDEDLAKVAKEYIEIEFDDYINIIELENVSGFDEIEDLERVIDQYNFHLIRLHKNKAELILINDNRFEEKYHDLETLLDNFGRKLIRYYHENTD